MKSPYVTVKTENMLSKYCQVQVHTKKTDQEEVN